MAKLNLEALQNINIIEDEKQFEDNIEENNTVLKEINETKEVNNINKPKISLWIVKKNISNYEKIEENNSVLKEINETKEVNNTNKPKISLWIVKKNISNYEKIEVNNTVLKENKVEEIIKIYNNESEIKTENKNDNNEKKEDIKEKTFYFSDWDTTVTMKNDIKEDIFASYIPTLDSEKIKEITKIEKEELKLNKNIKKDYNETNLDKYKKSNFSKKYIISIFISMMIIFSMAFLYFWKNNEIKTNINENNKIELVKKEEKIEIIEKEIKNNTKINNNDNIIIEKKDNIDIIEKKDNISNKLHKFYINNK